MSADRVAARYAKAFVSLLKDCKNLAEAQTFLAFCKLVEGNKELTNLFANVTVSAKSKQAVTRTMAEQLGLAEQTRNFLLVLADAGRLNILSEVGVAVTKKLDELNNVQTVALTTAAELTEEELNQFKNRMKQKTGSEIRVTTSVDATLLGGAMAQIGSLVYDGSVRAQLNRLSAEMVKEN